jgi:hypothetical protein
VPSDRVLRSPGVFAASIRVGCLASLLSHSPGVGAKSIRGRRRQFVALAARYRACRGGHFAEARSDSRVDVGVTACAFPVWYSGCACGSYSNFDGLVISGPSGLYGHALYHALRTRWRASMCLDSRMSVCIWSSLARPQDWGFNRHYTTVVARARLAIRCTFALGHAHHYGASASRWGGASARVPLPNRPPKLCATIEDYFSCGVALN